VEHEPVGAGGDIGTAWHALAVHVEHPVDRLLRFGETLGTGTLAGGVAPT
jgi:hypothetical protein